VDALDSAVWAALAGPHAALAVRSGRAARYPAEVSPFAAVESIDEDALRDLAAITPPGDFLALVAPDEVEIAGGFEVVQRLPLIQMVCEKAVAPPAFEPGVLGTQDVAEMLALVAATRPGPFGPRTIEMGRYVGIRDGGRLVAMGGERLRLPGHTEVSGICSDPAARGRGLAEAIVRAVASEIQSRGERPFLHVLEGSPSEKTAVALYARVGFTERCRIRLAILRRAQSAS
jgi:ribosomal protein S18 acetylase RimI-like enzyme